MVLSGSWLSSFVWALNKRVILNKLRRGFKLILNGLLLCSARVLNESGWILNEFISIYNFSANEPCMDNE